MIEIVKFIVFIEGGDLVLGMCGYNFCYMVYNYGRRLLGKERIFDFIVYKYIGSVLWNILEWKDFFNRDDCD